MSFTVYTHLGIKQIQYFFNIESLIKAMINNPLDRYHRNVR
jgi:hypothetical protein